MVPAIAFAPDTRLEIVVQDGRLEVIKTKKLQKVSQIPKSEWYQLKLAQVLARFIKTVPLGWMFLFYKVICPNFSAYDNLSSPARESHCLVIGILDMP